MQLFVRNVRAKFKADRFSLFHTGARQVFATQKLFPSEIPLTMKMASSNPLYIFWSNYHLSNFFEIFDVKQIYSREKMQYLNSIGVFPFFSFFCWNEINKNSLIKGDRIQIVFKKTEEWYIRWEQVATNNNEWQRVVQRVTTNNNAWQWMTKCDSKCCNKWQRVTTSNATSTTSDNK